MKVILLDDDKELCSILSEIFHDLDIKDYKCFHSFSELIEATKESPVSEIERALLDVNLGLNQPNGIDAYQWLIQHGFRGKTAFFTGHGRSHPLMTEVLKLPNTRLIEKPAPVDAIEAFVKLD